MVLSTKFALSRGQHGFLLSKVDMCFISSRIVGIGV